MGTVTLTATRAKLIGPGGDRYVTGVVQLKDNLKSSEILLLEFADHAALEGKVVKSANLRVYCCPTSNYYLLSTLHPGVLYSPDFASAGYGNTDIWHVGTDSYLPGGSAESWRWRALTAARSSADYETKAPAVEHGVSLELLRYSTDYPEALIQVDGANAPQLVVEYEDLEDQPVDPSPASGYVNPRGELTFTWQPYRYPVVGGTDRLSPGNFYWRYGTTGSWNVRQSTDVGVAVLPANLLHIGEATVQWQGGIQYDGAEKLTEICTLTTADSYNSGRIVDPVSGYINTGEPLTVTWTVLSQTGSTPTGFDLMYSSTGSVWYVLVSDHNTAATSCTIPADSIPAGNCMLRVRTYNADGAAGTWANVVTLTAIGAPPTPSVSVERGGPRPVVRWQASSQQAWELALDGETIASGFGFDSRCELDRYLSDGMHQIAVRVCNQYGMWSGWGSAALTVANDPGPELLLRTEEQRAAVIGEAVFHAEAVGTDLTWAWITRPGYDSQWEAVPGADSDTLRWPITEQDNGRQFRCGVSDAEEHSAESGTARILIESSARALYAPQDPPDTTAATGSRVTLHVDAVGGDEISYQWQYKSPTGSWTNSGYTSARTATLAFNASASFSGYQYRCIISSPGWQSWTTGPCTLTVASEIPEPYIRQQPESYLIHRPSQPADSTFDAARLTWPAGDYDKFYIYRDGELLAKTAAPYYVDRLTAGAHTYRVRGAYDDSGNYGLSNELYLTIQPPCVELIDVATGELLALPRSDAQNRVTRLSHQRQLTTTHYAGAALPSVEVTEWLDRTMTVSAADTDRELRTRLLALTGRLICLRDSYCNCVIGICPGWTARSQRFFDSFETTVTDAQWREALHYDPIG